jgi:hypothetical protein
MGKSWNKPVTDLAYVPRGMEVKPHISLPDSLAYYVPLAEPPKETYNVTKLGTIHITYPLSLKCIDSHGENIRNYK